MKDSIQITITRARTQLIIDLAVVEHKREEEKREETREKAISVFFLSLMFVRSFIPTGMIKY